MTIIITVIFLYYNPQKKNVRLIRIQIKDDLDETDKALSTETFRNLADYIIQLILGDLSIGEIPLT